MKYRSPGLWCVVGLVLLNAFLVAPLFRLEYSADMGSIESAYISISQQWIKGGIGVGWWPLWYCGTPGQNVYPPLLHVLVTWAAQWGRVTPALAHHAVTAGLYSLGAASMYWLGRTLGGNWWAGFGAGLLFSLWSPSAWLIPLVRQDIGGIWNPRRMYTLVRYGDGPHVVSLTMMGVALVLLWYTLERRKLWMMLPAALGLAGVVLTNWLGAFGLAAAVLCLLLTRPVRDWGVTAGIGVMAYAIASPWIPPSTLDTIQRNAQGIGGKFGYGWKNTAMLAGLVAAAGVLAWLLRRARAGVRFAASYTLLIGGIVMLAEMANIFVLPQPQRYHLELELGLCLLAGQLIPRRTALVAVLAALSLYAGWRYYKFSRDLVRVQDITVTSEYKVARWFEANMKGRRVMAPGSISFWMNAFADTPQFGGGFAQGLTLEKHHGVHYQVISGMNAGAKEGEIAVAWMKVYGVHGVAVSGPRSTEMFKPFRNVRKFDGLLKEMWRDGDDVVYEVPQRSASLARVIRKQDQLKAVGVYETMIEPLGPFIKALEDPSLPVTAWDWRNRSEALIRGRLERDHVLSIAISHHPGWWATVNGQRRALRRDVLGLMALEPECAGECVIELVYDGGTEMRVAKAASGAGLLAGLGLAFVGWRRRGGGVR